MDVQVTSASRHTVRVSAPRTPRLAVTDVARALAQAGRRAVRERTLGGHGRRALTGHARVGHCPVCSRTVVFVAVTDWLRDGYRCSRCDSIPRQRALIDVLE